ncbi:MAG: uracil-DNA glycosylase family protein [Rhodospirillaceae bacterium]|nr:uracil-DNA glycosylase family protein [Rhodospirillaceae bacterium]MBT3931896.1 uracil-DNA glycosylase family protein [Rhodospirillaceae bacterium]MBT4773112.1 uracil-DNA glycosylase family protein [Rhodospirillaceae bacterium]MBT5358426.1 uracil-DNA glycosylase family protein [Rhodospirillaceae bacterium]MBT5768464.1 uracil-DNA glycosylase family protein [Rhodospirillaceae bacterium]
MPKTKTSLDVVLADARACTACAGLPLGPLPLVRAGASARLLIISQAPGTRAHASGLSFDDPSGDRLRDWLGMDRDVFYDEARVAIMPMGFCYPGRLPRGGDASPRPECAPLWHAPILSAMREVRLTLYVGSYAIRSYLPGYRTMTDAVADWRTHGVGVLPLPHPSWRTNGWEKKNPWFTQELLPELKKRLSDLGL